LRVHRTSRKPPDTRPAHIQNFTEWDELKKCFEYLADYVQRAEPQTEHECRALSENDGTFSCVECGKPWLTRPERYRDKTRALIERLRDAAQDAYREITAFINGERMKATYFSQPEAKFHSAIAAANAWLESNS
jgi:hypothetical protein